MRMRKKRKKDIFEGKGEAEEEKQEHLPSPRAQSEVKGEEEERGGERRKRKSLLGGKEGGLGLTCEHCA